MKYVIGIILMFMLAMFSLAKIMTLEISENVERKNKLFIYEIKELLLKKCN